MLTTVHPWGRPGPCPARRLPCRAALLGAARRALPLAFAVAAALAPDAAAARAASPGASPNLPVVVLDAGHGGEQVGARGSCNVWEKDVTLAVALRTAAILAASGQARPELTRTEDVHVPLERRSQLANQLGAQLFVSIHANASTLAQARGVETFFLSLNAASRRVARLVRRENEGRLPLRAQAHDPLQRVLAGLAFDATHHESQGLAMRLQRSLVRQLGGRGRGVLQAPFQVLMGAQMPATLVEIGFLTHPQECEKLSHAAGQEAVAQGIVAGILAFLHDTGQPHAKAASLATRAP